MVRKEERMEEQQLTRPGPVTFRSIAKACSFPPLSLPYAATLQLSFFGITRVFHAPSPWCTPSTQAHYRKKNDITVHQTPNTIFRLHAYNNSYSYVMTLLCDTERLIWIQPA